MAGFIRILTLWLCGWVGIAVLPEGCRAIPSGHFNFDPEMVKVFGGSQARDSVTKAIIYQKVIGWISHNAQHGHHQRDGLVWSYNSYPEWARDIPFYHQKTIEKHIRDLEALGLLVARQFDRQSGNQRKFYGAPVQPSDGVSQMLLWGESQTPLGGARDSDLPIHKPAIHKSAMDKPPKAATAPARARKSKAAGVVAGFTPPLPEKDLPEKSKSAEAPERHDEGRDDAPTGESFDKGIAFHAPDNADPLPAALAEFFDGCTPAELADLVRQHGVVKLEQAKAHAQSKPGIQNPPGWARARLAGGWTPPILSDKYTGGRYAEFIRS